MASLGNISQAGSNSRLLVVGDKWKYWCSQHAAVDRCTAKEVLINGVMIDHEFPYPPPLHLYITNYGMVMGLCVCVCVVLCV